MGPIPIPSACLLQWSLTNFPSADGRRFKFPWSFCTREFSPSPCAPLCAVTDWSRQTFCRIDVIAEKRLRFTSFASPDSSLEARFYFEAFLLLCTYPDVSSLCSCSFILKAHTALCGGWLLFYLLLRYAVVFQWFKHGFFFSWKKQLLPGSERAVGSLYGRALAFKANCQVRHFALWPHAAQEG